MFGLLFAKVVINQNSYKLDRLFTYQVPTAIQESLKKGHRILVPFGRGNKPAEAYVLELSDTIDSDGIKLKSIIEILDENPILDEDKMKLISWIRNEYASTYMDAIGLFVPKGLNLKTFKEIVYLNDSLEISPEQYEVLDIIRKKHSIKESDVSKYDSGGNIIRQLLQLNLIGVRWNYKTNKNIKFEEYVSANPEIEDIDNQIEILSKKRAHKQVEVLSFLKYNNRVAYADLAGLFGISKSTINSMKSKGLLLVEKEEISRIYESDYIEDLKSFELNDEQIHSLDVLKKQTQEDKYKKVLMRGITGSGKTQVYIEFLEDQIISKGKDAIVLVPEIVLTPQILFRFQQRFKDRVALFHSKLSVGERFDLWRRVERGEVKIVIGPRSALFLPFKNLGSIIIDEFHDSSYRSDFSPHYNAIDISKKIMELNSGVLLLGSATPSIEEYYDFKGENAEIIELKRRTNKSELPEIEVIDMKEELSHGNKSIFSSRLIDEIAMRIINKEQVILFLNKRGHSSFVLCRKCGYVFKCKNCDISLTYHKYQNKGLCHYCGYEESIQNTCPSCSSKYIKEFGIGTQRVEEELNHYFEGVRILRMDRDTTAKKGSSEKILSDFSQKKADVLIGTQMVSKGLDFENVTLVGIISPDAMLNFPDYKSPEKTFQIITQVAGRCGRGEKKGLVILQTYEKDHYAIRYASQYDFEKFYNEELKLRKIFNYPPFNNIIRIVVSGESEKEVISQSQKAYDAFIYILRKKGYNKFDFILGPNPCSVSRISNKFRWQFIMKDTEIDFGLLKNASRYICREKRDSLFSKSVSISYEINPNNII